MPIIHGTTVGSALKYRLIIAILLMYIIYLRWSHNSTLSLVIEKARKDTGEYQSYAESVAAKLHIIFEHKERLEKIFDLRRLASRGKAKVHERTLRICQESLAMLSGQIDDCKHKNVGQVLLNSQERTELDNLRAQTAVLTSLNDSLNEVILKKEKIIEALSKRISDFQDSLSVCQEAVKKYVGVSWSTYFLLQIKFFKLYDP
ncbi:hypothetical protein KIN20_001407 [Parelaphostrongylus tenuis]|uniref:Uncharacterized protein n=1 Tax=Parelaphostrongylus tenuis TaxID=148309 RepID=A0AAD5MCT1_PARTN|nr:hypothetical protein KIN20_001407 [Parelaphostrongylus tenuis]